MDSDLKKRWVEALRSGRYQQGHLALKKVRVGFNSDETVHCCLGVLCEIEGLQQSPADDHHLQDLVGFVDSEGGSCLTSLPKTFRQKVGLEESEEGILIGLNDSYGKTFQEIADWIEDNL